MSGTDKTLRVYRNSWMPEHVALLCGISNAGGGVLAVASTSRNYSRGFKRMRKPFEQIPQLAQRELGIICTTQPVLEGPTLCLEIDIPSADPLKPISYKGSFRFFDDSTDEVLSLSSEEILERRSAQADAQESPDSAPQEAVDANEDPQELEATEDETGSEGGVSELEDLYAELKDLAARFRQAGGTVTVNQEESSATFIIPRAQDDAKIRKAKPTSEKFTERSVAAANGFDLTSTDEYILRVLNTNGRATAPRIAEVLGVSESTVRRSFKRLKQLGLIERVGSDKAGYWRVHH